MLESTDPGLSPYVAPNFRSVSDLTKEHGLAAFLRDQHISIVVEDDRLRQIGRFAQDSEWAQFRKAPQEFGFAATPLLVLRRSVKRRTATDTDRDSPS